MSLRLALFYAAMFLFVGIYLPFWPVWLTSRGMSAAEIGLLLAAGTWIRAFVPPTVAHLADRRGERKRVIVVLSAGAVASFSLYAVAGGFWMLLAVAILVAAFFSPIIPLSENLTMLMASEKGLNYGRIRLWGSIAFILAAGFGGEILTGREEDFILWLLLGASGLMLAAGLALPDHRPPRASRRQMPILMLLRDRAFVTFLAAASLVQASHAVYYGFATLHWRAAGIGENVIGALWAEGVVAEVVLFFFAVPLVRRLGPVRLLALAAAGGVIRWIVLGTTTSLIALFAVQILHALTFAAAHMAAMHFLVRAVAVEFSATAQSVYSGLAMGAVMGLTMMVSGWMFENFGGAAFYAMAAMSGASLAVTLLLARTWRGGPVVRA